MIAATQEDRSRCIVPWSCKIEVSFRVSRIAWKKSTTTFLSYVQCVEVRNTKFERTGGMEAGPLQRGSKGVLTKGGWGGDQSEPEQVWFSFSPLETKGGLV